MKKVLFVLFTILAFSLFIFDVRAVGCSLNQRVEYRNIASKVKMSYEGKEITKIDSNGEEYITNVLDLKIYNVSDQLSYKLVSGGKTAELDYSMSVNDIITVRIDDVSEIRNYVLQIYPTSYDCYTENVRSLKITLPKYNYESTSLVCDGVSDYYLCQKFILNNLDEDTFYQNVENYKKKLKNQKMEGIDFSEDNNNSLIVPSDFKYLIVLVIIGVGTVITVIALKKKGSAYK